MAANYLVLEPFVCKPQRPFTQAALQQFFNALQKDDLEQSVALFGHDRSAHMFARKRGNPTGSAAGHSGDRWLKDMLDDSRMDFAEFEEHVDSLLCGLRGPRSCRGTVQQLWDALTDEDAKPPHSAEYYTMNVFRALRHAFDISAPQRGVRFPACESSSMLWNDILLQYDGGAKRCAALVGLADWRQAAALVKRMQKVVPQYCMCDLACWLCLAKPHILASRDKKRKCAT